MKLKLSGKSVGGGLKISKAQQTTLTIVGATSVVLGAGIVLIMDFWKFIEFNGNAIEKQEAAIVEYSKSIKNSGACKASKSSDGIYSIKELTECNPKQTKPDEVDDSLRFKIMKEASSNVALESIGRRDLFECLNPSTGDMYTAEEIDSLIVIAEDQGDSQSVSKYAGLRQLCSTLRVIPDALPTNWNENALLSNIEKAYKQAGWNYVDPPSSTSKSSSMIDGLFAYSLNLKRDDVSASDINSLLDVISRDVRYINIKNITLKKKGDSFNLVDFSAGVEVYYAEEKTFKEDSQTLNMKKGKK